MLNPENSPDQDKIASFWTDKPMDGDEGTREYYSPDPDHKGSDDQPEKTEKGPGGE